MTVDFHHHYVPPRHLDAILAQRESGRTPPWSAELSLEEMDRNGIATAICSLVQPGVWLGDIDRSRALARECNEYGARMAADHERRFGPFAAIPLPDIDGSLREVEYALDTLSADGIGLMTSFDDKYLGHPAFAPVYEELDRRGAIVYVHPTQPRCCKGLVPGVPVSTIEYATDTTRTIASLVFSGTTTRYPNIRFIFSHGGGTVPFLLGRFERLATERRDKDRRLTDGAAPHLRRFHYEIAQAHHRGALDALTIGTIKAISPTLRRLTEPPLRDSQPNAQRRWQPPVAQPASPSHTADDPPGARACQHRGRTTPRSYHTAVVPESYTDSQERRHTSPVPRPRCRAHGCAIATVSESDGVVRERKCRLRRGRRSARTGSAGRVAAEPLAPPSAGHDAPECGGSPAGLR
jgi:predicted TIM-barrel fold metal-dependent hydrolase